MKRIILLLLTASLCFTFFACQSGQEAASGTASTAAAATDPAPVKTPYPDEPAGTAVLGTVGETPVYEYYFNALFTSYVTEALENEPDYDKDADEEEAYDYLVSYLERTGADGKTNLQLLTDKTADACRRMIILKSEGNKQGSVLSEGRKNSISAQWDTTAEACFAEYGTKYASVRTRDDAMRLLYHMNVNEVKAFSVLQNEVSDYISTWYTNGIRTGNEDLAAYYAAHEDDFRVVNLRAVYIEKTDENGADQRPLAETVLRRLEEMPAYMENLVKGYNQNKTLAASGGRMGVTGLKPGIPDEIKAWATKQSEDTLFFKSGKAEIVTTEKGYYVVLCESIQTYSEEPNDAVYESVGAAYKEAQLNAYVNELAQREEYRWTETNPERPAELARSWVSSAKPPIA